MFKQLIQIPNLVSLSRIFLTPIIGYYLARGDNQATIICVVLLFIAGLTDGLDGYLARKLNQVSDFGVALDPVADKIFAGILIVLLIIYRGFPIWMAVAIIGRDILIMAAGLLLLRGKKITLPSNLTGKYTFTVIAFLMGSYVIRFTFGIYFCSVFVIIYLLASMVNYTRVFINIKKGIAPPVFKDKPVYKIIRICLLLFFLIIFWYELFFNFISY